ncbi:MAG: hypothetical protein NVSMB12_02200 [Acidimicrobiales bacterium]
MSPGDRRRHRRVPLRVPVGIGTDDSDSIFEATTLDVSLGGLCIRGSDTNALDGEVVVVINAGGRIIPAKAKVVRRASTSDQLGLQFLRVSPGPRRTLRTWLGEGPGPRAAF